MNLSYITGTIVLTLAEDRLWQSSTNVRPASDAWKMWNIQRVPFSCSGSFLYLLIEIGQYCSRFDVEQTWTQGSTVKALLSSSENWDALSSFSSTIIKGL